MLLSWLTEVPQMGIGGSGAPACGKQASAGHCTVKPIHGFYGTGVSRVSRVSRSNDTAVRPDGLGGSTG